VIEGRKVVLLDVFDEGIEMDFEFAGIDAPLSFPIEGFFRECERKLQRMGITLIPPRFIEKIALRGMEIAELLRSSGVEVFEVYPYATRKILNIAPKANKKKEEGRKMISVELKPLLQRLNPRTTQALEGAAGLCVARGHYEVMVEHLLLKMCDDPDGDVVQVLSHFDVDAVAFLRAVEETVEALKGGNTGRPVFSPTLMEWIQEAWLLASVELGLPHIRSGVLFSCLCSHPQRFGSGPYLELLEGVGPDELVPWAQNPRRNEKAVREVMRSIERYGFGAPVVARRATREIIAGHTRVEAARRLGLERIPVRFLDIDERAAHELALVDNRSAEIAEWDESMLRQLMEDGLDLSELGWSEEEVRELAADGLDDVSLDGPDWSGPEQDTRVAFEVIVDSGAEAEIVRDALRALRARAPSIAVRVMR